MDWAYINRGRIKQVDWWEWAIPAVDEASVNVKDVFAQIFGGLREDRNAANDVISVIGFDGNNWYSGGYAKSELLLNDTVENAQHYSTDFVGRLTDWIHGFVSNAGGGTS
jgi:hypothetical protein